MNDELLAAAMTTEGRYEIVEELVALREQVRRQRNIIDDAHRSLRAGRPEEATEYLRAALSQEPPDG